LSCLVIATSAINDVGHGHPRLRSRHGAAIAAVGAAQYVRTFHGQPGSLTIRLVTIGGEIPARSSA
jgi:hypothetical protein